MMKIITVSSLKGGVGKTTLSVFTARALAQGGARVLGIDLDHNNNFTDYWLRDAPEGDIEARNVMHALTRARAIEDVIFKDFVLNDSPDIIPATPSLSRIGYELARDPGVAMRFRSALKKLDYDYVVIDTPPSLSLELTIGLYAADLVLVPVSASRWTVQGYQIITDEVRGIEEAIGRAPELMVVPSMVTPKEAEDIRAIDAWKCSFGTVCRDPAVKGAVNAGRALTAGTVAERAFLEIAEEVRR